MTQEKYPLEWRVDRAHVAYDVALQTMATRADDIAQGRAGEMVWLLEHPPLYTAGTSAKPSDLVDPDRFPVYDAGRGGQYTYHGPGQRVVYFMLDLRKRGKDLRRFIYNLEALMIESVFKASGIKSERRKGRIGVWVTQEDGREEKIAAVGVRIRQWISFHGIAINVNPDLSHFEGIVPCGIADHGVTSFANTGSTATMDKLDAEIRRAFDDIFGQSARPMKYSWAPSPEPTPIKKPRISENPADTHPTFQV